MADQQDQQQPNIPPQQVALAQQQVGQPQQQNPMAGNASDMMQQSQASMNNPMAQAVPHIESLMQHPLVQGFLKVLSAGAQAYGWSAMQPEERLQRQQMEQQKAEALAKQAAQQQQLGYEGQRVGLEGQRVGIEQQRATQEGAYQTGMLSGAEKSRAIEQQRAGYEGQRVGIDQQRADQEHQVALQRLDNEAKTLEESIRAHKAEEKIGGARLSIEQKANDIASRRLDIEAKHYEDTLSLQGKQFDRQLAEDERKTLHASLDGYYKEHPWMATLTGTGAQTLQRMHKNIDDYIDQKIGVGGQGSPLGAKDNPNVTVSGAPGVTHNYVPGQGIVPVGGQK